MIRILAEGMILSFWLLLVCVVGIADGPERMVVFYEQDVKERVVERGLTTPERIRKTSIITGAALWIPVLFGVPYMVYHFNGASGFLQGFLQMTAVLLIMGLFDRIFIDWYWVGHTKAWIIPGTEDLMPYIPKKAIIQKWTGTLIGFPLLAALTAGIMHLFGF